MMIRARKLAAIPLCFGRLFKTSVPTHELIEIVPSHQYRAINFIGSTNGELNFMGSTNAFPRMVYDYTTNMIPSLLTSCCPWEDKSATIIRRSIAQIIQDICVACYWRTDAGETHGSFSLTDISVADGKLIIPSSKDGDGLLSDSFEKTIKEIFLGDNHISSDEFSDFMKRVSNIKTKEDYKRLYFHTLLKDKEGRIDFVASSVEWLRGFPPVHSLENFDWKVAYGQQFKATVDISHELNKIETTNNLYDTFNDMYKFTWRTYSQNSPLAAAIYIRNALRHFNHTRSSKGYSGFMSRQWVTHKLYDLFSKSPFEMYRFLVKHDGIHGIKLDMNEEFRGVRRT